MALMDFPIFYFQNTFSNLKNIKCDLHHIKFLNKNILTQSRRSGYCTLSIKSEDKDKSLAKRWSEKDLEDLKKIVDEYHNRIDEIDYEYISKKMGKTKSSCIYRARSLLYCKNARSGRWSFKEDSSLIIAFDLYESHSWRKISEYVKTRDEFQCRHRWYYLKQKNVLSREYFSKGNDLDPIDKKFQDVIDDFEFFTDKKVLSSGSIDLSHKKHDSCLLGISSPNENTEFSESKSSLHKNKDNQQLSADIGAKNSVIVSDENDLLTRNKLAENIKKWSNRNPRVNLERRQWEFRETNQLLALVEIYRRKWTSIASNLNFTPRTTIGVYKRYEGMVSFWIEQFGSFDEEWNKELDGMLCFANSHLVSDWKAISAAIKNGKFSDFQCQYRWHILNHRCELDQYYRSKFENVDKDFKLLILSKLSVNNQADEETYRILGYNHAKKTQDLVELYQERRKKKNAGPRIVKKRDRSKRKNIHVVKTKNGYLTGKWSHEEDTKLLSAVNYPWEKDGKIFSWINVSEYVGTRNYQQCQYRYTNYLSYKIKNTNWSHEEDLSLVMWILSAEIEKSESKNHESESMGESGSDNPIKYRKWTLMSKKMGFYRSPLIIRARCSKLTRAMEYLKKEGVDFSLSEKFGKNGRVGISPESITQLNQHMKMLDSLAKPYFSNYRKSRSNKAIT
ncbi:Cyclin-D-binding Myb-like transcription factor 1 [Smittium culicis]|uniref:Cyclin-D-binding Myb-like transcription factor 1 n=1 Tax=Smittium culicis TaxID=133412 RepID=A0A1R1YI17_9FUNG|nr:Cyclin-D-binding Myb-like transcription factor 1 [Smittium culicis]